MTVRSAFLAMAAFGALIVAPTPSFGQQPELDWKYPVGNGTNPLTLTRKWDGPTTIASLQTLLTFKGAAEPAPLSASRDYIVIVGANRWTEIYLLRRGCLSQQDSGLKIDDTCDLQDTRIRNSRAVSIVGLKTFGASSELEWNVVTKKRKRLDVMGFVSFVLPSIAAGGLGILDANEYRYSVAVEDVVLKTLPADHAVSATLTRFPSGAPERKETFGRTFNNYGDEYFSFGVGAGVKKVKDVSLNLNKNSLTANDISKLKTYGLVGAHPVAGDPFAPGSWKWPYLVGAIEISTEKINYGGGLGYRLWFIENTSVAVVAIHSLPDLTDAAKAEATPADLKRKWRIAYLVHYTFPLPKPEKKEE